jgi:circadian clock protein KaiC
MIRSGIAPLDEHIGGLSADRMHVITGGPGSGKTALALQFLHEGLSHGESGLMLTSGRTDDVKSLARYLGFELDTHIQAGRLVMLRYRQEFAARFAFVVSAAPLFDDLKRLCEPVVPRRIVVDSFAPFLAEGSAAGNGASGLVEYLEGARATSVLTFPDELTERYDRRLEVVVQSAAAIFRASRWPPDRFRLDVVTTRYQTRGASAEFTLRRGEGVISHAPGDISAAPVSRRPRSMTGGDSSDRVVVPLES